MSELRAVKTNPVTGALLTEGVPTSAIVYTLLNAVLVDGTSAVFSVKSGKKLIQASIVGTGAVSSTVTWYGSLVNSTTNAVLLATSTLSGTNSDVTSEEIATNWPYMFCIVASITGTAAAVSAQVGV